MNHSFLCSLLLLQSPIAVALTFASRIARRDALIYTAAAATSAFPASATDADAEPHGLLMSVAEYASAAPPSTDRPEGLLRRIYCKADQQDGILLVSFFSASAAASMRQAASGSSHSHFVDPTNFRSLSEPMHFADTSPGAAGMDWSAGPLTDGLGLMVGAHGLTVGHSLWQSKFTSASSDEEHARYGVRRSIAGRLLTGSTDAPVPGPLVLHVTAEPEDARRLASQLSPSADTRVQQALSMGIMRPPIYAASGRVVKDVVFEGAQ